MADAGTAPAPEPSGPAHRRRDVHHDARMLCQRATGATEGEMRRLATEIPEAAVDLVAAAGAPGQIRTGIERFHAAGAGTVVLVPLTETVACLRAAVSG